MAIRPPVALIAGPTASGKSALALVLAEKTGGVIVNADSGQIYRDLPILSAAPTDADRKRAEHRLYGVVDASQPCSAADWAVMAKREVAAIHGSDRLPILVGGSGLYVRTLLDGIAPVPSIEPQVRAEVRSATVEDNRARLKKLDPEAWARLKPADTARIARALEVVVSTRRTLKQWQERREGGIGESIELRPLILLPPRDWLYQRCGQRFRSMMRQGAAEEVSLLLARRLAPSLPAMRAIGVRELGAMLRGEIDREQAEALGSQATRNYAKRQYTWFAHQPPAAWPRFAEPLDDNRLPEALALLGVSA